jgi:membrane-bound serine protease (ClpP class)
MWWGERLLAIIANPNIAFLLLVLGFYGLLFELYSPGWGVPGTVGVICLVVGFFALSVLPVNIVGLMLILIALALFIAEAFVVSFGALTIGGITCLILGGLMLVDSPIGFPRISFSVVIATSLATAAITVFLLGRVMRSHRTPVQMGAETMVGTTAIAQDAFQPEGQRYKGFVRIHGEIWSGISPTPVAAGETVIVERISGLNLDVRPESRDAIADPKVA